MQPPADPCCHRCGQSPREPGALHCPTCGLPLVEREQHERYARDPFLGTLLGDKYPVLARLGEGGMGAVYRSWHPDLEMDLALKVIRYDTQFQRAEARERFRQEAKVLAGLAHHAVVRFYDFGVEDDGTLFIALEYVAGDTLQWHFERGGLSVRQLVGVMQTVAEAVAEAESHGVVHRDLKPENIMLVRSDDDVPGPLQVKVLDFGLVKLREQSGRRLTGTGLIPGTPRYMAPEQCAGQDVDHRSDIYTLCTVLYEGLVGRLPFAGSVPLVAFSRKASEEAPPLPVAPHLPPELAAVLRRGLAREPKQRYASAAELAADLAALPLGPACDAPLAPVQPSATSTTGSGQAAPRTPTPTLPGVRHVPAASPSHAALGLPAAEEEDEDRAATALLDEERAATWLADDDRSATQLFDDDRSATRLFDDPAPRPDATGPAPAPGDGADAGDHERAPTELAPEGADDELSPSGGLRSVTTANRRIPTAPPVGPAPVQPFITRLAHDPMASEFEPAGGPLRASTWVLLVLGGLAAAALLVALYWRSVAPPEEARPLRRVPGAVDAGGGPVLDAGVASTTPDATAQPRDGAPTTPDGTAAPPILAPQALDRPPPSPPPAVSPSPRSPGPPRGPSGDVPEL